MVRFKSRYLVCEFKLMGKSQMVNESLGAHQLLKDIRESIAAQFGDYSLGRVMSQLSVKYYRNKTGMAIIKAPHVDFNMVWAAITLLKTVQGIPVSVSVRHVAGTVRNCQEWIIAMNKEETQMLAASTISKNKRKGPQQQQR
jgi:ribonuclease P/MRP protein subunit POP5